MSYAELEDWESLEKELNSFRVFMSRNKNINPGRKRYYNFFIDKTFGLCRICSKPKQDWKKTIIGIERRVGRSFVPNTGRLDFRPNE